MLLEVPGGERDSDDTLSGMKRDLKREAGPKHPVAMCVSGERKISHKRVFPDEPKKKKRGLLLPT
jgi:hypothetical protein